MGVGSWRWEDVEGVEGVEKVEVLRRERGWDGL
jgi:hypothetical protein